MTRQFRSPEENILGHLTSHEVLINIIASSVLTMNPSPFSALKATGELKERFGYEIKIPILNETIENILQGKGARIPDLILANDRLKMVVAVECKTELTLETTERLSKQIDFYASEAFHEFAKSFVIKPEKSEIWIVTYNNQEKLSERIANFVEKKKAKTNLQCNIVVWEVELKKTDEAIIRKIYGDHQDIGLNMYFQANDGIETPLPQLELLIDSSLTYSQRVARIGRRVFSFMVSKSLTEEERIVSVTDFKNKFGDAIMTEKELVNCFRYLTKFIPEIGWYVTEKRCIVLKARPDLSKIKNKIVALENVADEEFKVELSKTDRRVRLGRSKTTKKPIPFKGSLEPWIKKQCRPLRDLDNGEILSDLLIHGPNDFSKFGID